MKFISGRTRTDLDTDRMLLFALVRAVEIFGEATSKVSSETQAAPANIPWPQIIAMRNRLIHAYVDIDRAILWKTVSDEIPLLPVLRNLTGD